LGHKTSHYVLFRDLVQRAMNEGRLKFGDKTKPKMQVDVDPLKDVDAMYTKVASCNMVEAIVDVVDKDVIETIGDEPKEKMGASQKFDYIFDISAQVVSRCMISRWSFQESREIKGKFVPTKCLSIKWLIPKLVGTEEGLNSNSSEPSYPKIFRIQSFAIKNLSREIFFDNRTSNINGKYLEKHSENG